MYHTFGMFNHIVCTIYNTKPKSAPKGNHHNVHSPYMVQFNNKLYVIILCYRVEYFVDIESIYEVIVVE
jgi:hypothetical protein